MTNKRIAFLTEANFRGTIERNFEHTRTEYAWYIALGAIHYPIIEYYDVSNYDYVFIILPKGDVNLNSAGSKLTSESRRPLLFNMLDDPNFLDTLKNQNSKICFVQEGPSWYFTDYELVYQFKYHNFINSCDMIFTHNEYDKLFFTGLFPDKEIYKIPTLLIEDTIQNLKSTYEDKTIIGGNFANWYGGFQSYAVARTFNNEIFVPEMHCKRESEEQIDRLHHIGHTNWTTWMNNVSTFKYAVHLMPTIAAGTFNLNMAYFGIPCIGNEKVDTQRLCFPDTSIDVNDMVSAKRIAQQLLQDKDFYTKVSLNAIDNYKKYFHETVFISGMQEILNDKRNLGL